MSNAWETTVEDVKYVLRWMNRNPDNADEIHDQLNMGEIEKEALRANDMDEQIIRANNEIQLQIEMM